jgi:predicted AAA+ superfamily ATPase
MFHRLLNIPLHRSCLLFGARGTGKSTLLGATLAPATTHTLNLLEADT